MKWLIHKHQLQPSTLLHLTRGAEVLSAQAQGEYIYLWVLSDPKEKGQERRAFICKPDDEEFDNPPEGYRLRFVSTVQIVKVSAITAARTWLQWHVFEVEKKGLVS